MAQQSENRKTAITACILIGIFLVAVFTATLVPRNPTQTSNIEDTTTKALKETYHAMFGPKPLNANDYSGFNTPVSMYLGVIIALNHGGWNASSLQNMTVYASLEYCRLKSSVIGTTPYASFSDLNSVTAPVNDYSPVTTQDSDGNWVSYRYLWTIVVKYSTGISGVPAPGMYWVDADTAELISLIGPLG